MSLPILLSKNYSFFREVRGHCFYSKYALSYYLSGTKTCGHRVTSHNFRMEPIHRKSTIMYSTSTQEPKDDNIEKKSEQPSPNISKKEKFKKAIKDYGATVIIFHVTLSLTTLGLSYLLVSSGLDIVSVLKSLGVGQSILESKITQGASTFVVAYAVHKVFAPVRITITLTCTPLIVRYLRNIGLLKKPVS